MDIDQLRIEALREECADLRQQIDQMQAKMHFLAVERDSYKRCVLTMARLVENGEDVLPPELMPEYQI